MKRGFAWLLTLLALLGLLSGCGGGGDTTASDTASNSAATEGADDPGGSYGAWAEAEVAEDSGGTAEDGASDRLENAKMIYTARMEVETTAFDTADADLRTLVESWGAILSRRRSMTTAAAIAPATTKCASRGSVPAFPGPGGDTVPRHLSGADQRER